MSARRLLLRRKGPVARMVGTAFLGSMWCVVGVIWVLGMMRETDSIATTVELHISIRQGTGADTVGIMHRSIAHMPAIARVRLERGPDVARSFFRSMDLEDPSLAEIITMPDVLLVTPRPAFCTTDRMKMLERTLRSTYPEIERIVWPEALVHAIERRQSDLVLLGTVAGALSLFFFVLALWYAFRAEIHTADADLAIGTIMGAGPWFIAAPHILVGIIATITGTGLAALVAWASWTQVLAAVPWTVAVAPQEIGLTLGGAAIAGCLASIWQSIFATRRASKHA